MKKSRLMQAFLCAITSLVLVSSCKKNDVDNTPADKATIAKVTDWLQGEKTPGKDIKNEKIQRLADNLDFSGISIENLDNGEQVMVVPISKNFVSKNNPNENPQNNLVLVLNSSGQIQKGNIVQFMPEDKTKPSLDAAVYKNVLDAQPLSVDGKFSVLSTTDWLLYELGYKEGKLISAKIVSKKQKEATNIRATDEWCEYWTIDVWYYHLDTGEWEYIGSYISEENCECVPGTRCDELGDDEDSGGGGGENDGGGGNSQLPLILMPMTAEVYVHASRPFIDLSGKETRNVRYEWNFNQSVYGPYVWLYKSIDEAVQERMPGEPWKFVSYNHLGISPYYYPEPCVTPDLVVYQAIPTIAPDGLSVTIALNYSGTATYTCGAGNIVHSATAGTSKTWLAN